jgi:hypothetical protein
MTAITAPAFPMTRGRRAALAVGVPVCLLLVAYMGLDLVATFGQGRYPVSYTVPASARALTLNVAAGQVLIKQAAAGPATIAGTARYSLIRSTVTERTVGGDTTVRYHCLALPVGNCELDATATVPAGMPVSANTDGGNATVTGITGRVTLSSGGGNVAADRTSGPLTLDTSGGNIKATDVTSPALTATTGGGDITAVGVSAAAISATTSGGNIKATGVSSAAVTASSGGGNIEVVFASVPHDVQVNTSGGNITLVLPPGDTQYHVNAHTDGGSVTDGLTQNTYSKNVITATSGGGNITLRYQ